MPERAGHLQLVDPSTGEAYTEQCVGCREWRQRFETANADLERAEKDLRQKRAQITALKRDKVRERREYARRQDIQELFQFWQAATGHVNSKLGAKRFDAVRARLEEDEFEPWQIRLAILGAAVSPFVPKGGPIKDDIELVCRDEGRLEDHANRAARWGRQQMA